uniref:DUF7722 domain-containing protein n=1 Tax=Vitis vinifera TaxID=29760 RepID=F6H6H2_VITVI
MESVSVVLVKKAAMEHEEQCWEFQMPLHYPRHSKSDYESMPGWKLDCLSTNTDFRWPEVLSRRGSSP